MSILLPSHRLADVAPILADFPSDLAFVEAIFVADCPSYRIWVDELPAPKMAIALHRLGVGVLAGALDSERIRALLAGAVAPDDGWAPIRYLIIPSPEWVTTFQRLFGHGWAAVDRVSYRVPDLLPGEACYPEISLPEGYSVQPIDLALASRIAVELDPDFAAYWPQPDDFLRRGLGFAVLADTRIVSVAYAALPIGRYLEISVFTHAEFRGRGLCAAACLPLLKACAERKLIPLWNACAANLASIAVAEKLGLRRKDTHQWLQHTP